LRFLALKKNSGRTVAARKL